MTESHLATNHAQGKKMIFFIPWFMEWRQLWSTLSVSCFAFVYTSIAAPDPVSVNLGGPRKVEAKISTQDGEYRVDVRMLAVKAFDNATNNRINRDKARLLALQALIRHVSGKNEAEATMSGVRIIATGTDKQFFTLTLSLPKDKFMLVQAPAAAVKPPKENQPAGKPAAVAERLKWKSELFTKNDDFQRTIDLLKEQFIADIVVAEKAAKDFENSIAEIEERTAAAFKALRAEIAAENLLLTIEMEELVAKTKNTESQVMAKLTQAVERKDKEEKDKKVKEASQCSPV